MSDKLSVRSKLCYAVGDSGLTITCVMVSVLFALFMTDVVGLSPSMAAVAIFAGRSWDYLVDPILGYITNKTRTRWGSYRPWLMFCSVPMGLCFGLMWWIPPLESQTLLTAYYAVAYFLFVAFYSMLEIPYGSLTPRLTGNYDERTSLTSYRMLFSISGQLVAFLIPFLLLSLISPENSGIVLRAGFLAGGASAVLMLITAFGTRERVQPIESEEKITIIESLRAAAKNPPLLFTIGMYTFTITGFEITNAMMMYFLSYSLNVKSGISNVMVAYFGVSLLTIPLWNRLAQKKSKNFAYIVSLAGMIVCRLIMICLPMGVSPLAIWVVMGMTGFFFSGAQSLPWAIIPDSLEYDEYKTGQRHEGVFYALMATVRGAFVSLVLPLSLVIMEKSGYVANQAIQSPSSALAIRLLFGGLPILFFAITILLNLKYPMSRTMFEEIKLALVTRHTADTAGSIQL